MQDYSVTDTKHSSLAVLKEAFGTALLARHFHTIKEHARYLWEGPAKLPAVLRLEWRFAAIRWLGILFLAPILAHLNLSGRQLLGAYGVLIIAIAYNLSLQILLVRHTRMLLSGYVTTVCDGLLDIAMVVAAGGFDSPFSYILYTVVVATAMRYGYGPVLAMALLFISADAIESLFVANPLDSAFLFRSAFLLITALLAGYLHEQAKYAQVALEERLNQANSLNKELEAFSYSVSHDLRAPLRSVDGFSQALLEDYGEKLDEDGKDHLRRVRAASQRMAELIDDLLDLSRVTRTEIHREIVDLSQLARAVTAKLQQMHPDRRVTSHIARNVSANGDPQLLTVVLENLFSNAWKFTEKTSRPHIEFGLRRQASEDVYYISDNGVGFDMAYADKLFGAFQRLHSTSEFEGNGIGLATVQRIIHRHGGRVWGESPAEAGATFYFTL